MPADRAWHIYEIPIPQHIRYTFNYIAVSDPYSEFELGSLLLTPGEIASGDLQIQKVTTSKRDAKPLECTYRPCPAVLSDRGPQNP